VEGKNAVARISKRKTLDIQSIKCKIQYNQNIETSNFQQLRRQKKTFTVVDIIKLIPHSYIYLYHVN